jgi:cation diffusion facilitator CzcD-associated flavoprotein CzcO
MVRIAGPGPLRYPSLPQIFKSFKGPLIHSAKWDHSICLKDKVVAVVGSGASAIQIIPGIVKDVKKLYSFQRYLIFE